MLAPPRVRIVPVVVGREVGQVASRVELFEQIRRDRRLEQLSIRELAERHTVAPSARRSLRQFRRRVGRIRRGDGRRLTRGLR